MSALQQAPIANLKLRDKQIEKLLDLAIVRPVAVIDTMSNFHMAVFWNSDRSPQLVVMEEET